MKKKIIIITSIIVIIAIILAAVFLLKKEKEEAVPVYVQPCIYLPSEGGYVQAWESYLPEVQEMTGIADLGIKTYSTPQEFEQIFMFPEKHNIIWAEVPVTGEYNFSDLAQKGYLQEIKDLQAEYYIYSLFNLIQEQFNPKTFYALPYSCDLWVFLQRKKPLEENPMYEIAVPGKDVENVFAMLTEVLSTFTDEEKDISLQEALLQLEEFSTNKTYQNNPFTYTNYDVLQLVLEGKSRFTPISVSQFLSMSYEEQAKYSLKLLNDKVIANTTVLLFPKLKKAESKTAVIAAQKILANPSLNFKIVDARDWQPIRINSSSRNVHISTIREDARMASYSGIPWLSYSSTEEKEHIFAEIQKKLLTK
ncbi:MAG TPA: hypothetical protein PLR39_03990 [Treponemataceae bacterium]|nr:hypothetical protein [Treponemataceae bacterium]